MSPDLVKEIIMGVLRSIALVIGGGMVVYAIAKLNSNPTMISIGGGMIAFATGGSILNKTAAEQKIQTALYTMPPGPTP